MESVIRKLDFVSVKEIGLEMIAQLVIRYIIFLFYYFLSEVETLENGKTILAQKREKN